MPGLMRGIARTAVIAGTATAVSNRVSRRQADRWSQQEQQPQYAAEPAPVAAAPPAPPVDMVAQLQGLADLKDKGILTEAEFAAQKAKLLAT
jgi:Short C-terminal domain